MNISIGCDHAGFEYKEAIKQMLIAAGNSVNDCGTDSTASIDYPDYAHPVAQSIVDKHSALGILICGSGNGVTMTANKYPEVRAALCWENEIATLARQHNDANIICIPARFVDLDLAKKMVNAFISTDFEGGRHARRVDKIACCQ